MVADLDNVEREVCACGYSVVILSVAGFEAVFAAEGELVELRPRGDLSLAA